jgi:hypothetical protein
MVVVVVVVVAARGELEEAEKAREVVIKAADRLSNRLMQKASGCISLVQVWWERTTRAQPARIGRLQYDSKPVVLTVKRGRGRKRREGRGGV